MKRKLPLIALVAAALLVGVFLVTRRDGSDAASRAPVAAEGSQDPARLVSGAAQAGVGASAPQEADTVRRAVEEAAPEPAPDARRVSRRRPGSIVVRFVYPDGSPAAGAAAWHVEGGAQSSRDVALAREETRRAGMTRTEPSFGGRDWRTDPLARHHIADDQGCIYPNVRGRGSSVGARIERDGRVHQGSLSLDDEAAIQPGTEHRVVLEPSELARVRVVDPTGDGVPDVLVAVVVERDFGRGQRQNFTLTSARTDRDGRAVLEDRPEGWASHRSQGMSPRVVALVCSDPLPTAALDPVGEVTLVVPPTGSLVIEIPGALSRYAVMRLGDERLGLSAEVRDGRAHFAPVALGSTFDAELSTGREKTKERVVGPTADAPHAVHRWSTAAPRGAYTFTLLDESGAPIRERLVSVEYHESDGKTHRGGGSGYVSTDTVGRVAFRPISDPIGTSTLRLLAYDVPPGGSDRRPLSATITVPAERRGKVDEDTELGDVVLVGERRLAAGRVVDREGDAVADAEVAVRSRAVEGRPARRVAHTLTADDGSFVVWGREPSDAELELVASARGFLESNPLALVGNDRDLVVRLDAAASVRFVLRTQEGLESHVLPEIVSANGTTRPVPVLREEFGRPGPGTRAYFIERLTSGPARLVVRSVASREPLFERDVVLAGGLVDLGSIDLRDSLPSFRLVVRASNGARPNFISVEYEGREGTPVRDVRSPARLPRPPSGRSITVHAPGFLSATVAVERDEVEVVLTPGVLAVLRLPPGYPRPQEGTTVFLSFARREGTSMRSVGAWATVSDADEYRIGLDAPGTFVAHMLVGRGEDVRHQLSVDFELTAAALANGTPVELPFDLDEWTRALQAFEKR